MTIRDDDGVEGTEPGAPTNVVATVWLEDASNIDITWDIPDDGGSPILKWWVHVISFYETVQINTSTEIAVGDAPPVTLPCGAAITCHVSVSAQNAIGVGPHRRHSRSQLPDRRLRGRRPVRRAAAETDLVAVGVVERDLADAVVVGLAFRGLDATGDDLVHHGVEVVHEDSDCAVPRVLRLLLDRDRTVLGELPTSSVSWARKVESPRSCTYQALAARKSRTWISANSASAIDSH